MKGIYANKIGQEILQAHLQANLLPKIILVPTRKIANFFMNFGLPKWAVLSTISAMPVVELRGAIPDGVWMGLPIQQVLPICVLGNMVPIVPLLFLLKNEAIKNLMSPILKRAEKKASGLGVGSVEAQWVALAAFVGIPLPGTGAWTGAMGAFLLGMPTPLALSAIFAGVVSAGCIMTALTLAGRTGGLVALSASMLFFSFFVVCTPAQYFSPPQPPKTWYLNRSDQDPCFHETDLGIRIRNTTCTYTLSLICRKRLQAGPSRDVWRAALL